ncbi:MAG: ABC transporter substrate-binding protein [Lachnospiraceae bacterium]|nr:ABC transporter substrate-binding protein [Lachnospiraceae bacterium]
MKKRVLALALTVAMAGTMLTGCGEGGNNAANSNTSSSDGGKVVKIGVYEPASGDNGAGGKQETLGMQYANSKTPTVEIGGEEYTVELEIVDNESSNDKGPSAASSLVSSNVSVVLGSYGSGVSIAASDVFKEAGIPAIGVTCTNPQVTEGNTHYFRICFLDPFQGTVLANFANDNFSAKKAYILTKLGDDYSTGLGHYFKEAFTGLGGEVVEETFQEGNSDFISYITSAKNAGADVFFAPVSTEAAALIIEQSAAQGLGIPLMAGDTWDSNVILNAAKGKDVEIYVTTFYQEGGNEEFDNGIKEWINSDSTAKSNNGGDDTIAAVTAMGYDAYYVALEALKAAGSTDAKAVNEALWDVTYTGVSGEIAFNETGDALRDVAYVKCANTETGAWDFVAVQGVN